MNNTKVEVKNKISIFGIIIRFFFGFLLPFVVINGLILFLFIQVPSITVFDEDSSEYENEKIKFTVDCMLPISEVKAYYEDTEIPYSKLDNIYTIEAKNYGSYQITAKAINGATFKVIAPVESKDVIPPAIDIENALITNNLLVFSIYDAESEINFDSVYATLEDGTRITPSYIDKSSGTVQFQLNSTGKITVHVEDIEGNPTETTFITND
ncbi:MAG: hypothetical protein IJ790_02495 [Lachnospiraceae bacterium]|nr:hypothetical protein [Lachnospiraceae bacterium]